METFCCYLEEQKIRYDGRSKSDDKNFVERAGNADTPYFW